MVGVIGSAASLCRVSTCMVQDRLHLRAWPKTGGWASGDDAKEGALRSTVPEGG